MSVRISYFDARGLTEPIRWILSYGKVDFEDVRAPLETFPVYLPPEIKEKCRWGQVPLAEFDGKQLNQSLAIARYFARKHNLVPKDDYEAALCDEFVDSIVEYLKAWFGIEMELDPVKHQEKKDELLKSGRDKYLTVLEGIIQANGGQYLVGKSLTWADLYLTQTINHAEIGLGVQLMTDFPGIRTVYENVTTAPGIKEWLDKRPHNKY